MNWPRKCFCFFFILLFLVVVQSEVCDACSSFLLKRGKSLVMGKSYDWHHGDGLLITNKRGMRKRALLLPGSGTPARWVSRYGSVTFNQYGREFPLGGMNEKGLAIEVLWLKKTRHSAPQSGIPTLNELQWIQYHLDTSATLSEMQRRARKVQIAKIYAQVHYFACDANGVCAAFEWLGGKMVVHSGRRLPAPVLTNHTYSRSLRFFQRVQKKKKSLSTCPSGSGSLARFCRLAAVSKMTRTSSTRSVTAGFRWLRDVRIHGYTQWNILYELKPRRLHFRIPRQKRQITLELSTIDFGCSSSVQTLDLRGTIRKGPKLRWSRYSTWQNARMIHRAMRKLARVHGLRGFPLSFLLKMSLYPRTTHCLTRHKKT